MLHRIYYRGTIVCQSYYSNAIVKSTIDRQKVLKMCEMLMEKRSIASLAVGEA